MVSLATTANNVTHQLIWDLHPMTKVWCRMIIHNVGKYDKSFSLVLYLQLSSSLLVLTGPCCGLVVALHTPGSV